MRWVEVIDAELATSGPTMRPGASTQAIAQALELEPVVQAVLRPSTRQGASATECSYRRWC